MHNVSTTDVYAAIEANPKNTDIICALIKVTPAELLMLSTKDDLDHAPTELSIYGTNLLRQYVQGRNLSLGVISKYPRAIITAAFDVYCDVFLTVEDRLEWEKMLYGLLNSCTTHIDITRDYNKKIAKSDLGEANKGVRMAFLVDYI